MLKLVIPTWSNHWE